jgi:putative membrane protein
MRANLRYIAQGYTLRVSYGTVNHAYLSLSPTPTEKEAPNGMWNSNEAIVSRRASFIPQLTLAWYLALFVVMAMAPVDPKIWWGQNILPVLFVATLVLTHRSFPLSNASYMLITVWLTLHTIAVHYTYPKVPLGIWLDQWFNFHRNHFDRIVHFSFGFFLTLPLVEVFRRRCNAKGWLLPYLVVMTVLGFSAFWEIIEAWIGQVAHPDVEQAFVGHQGDVWDPQRDMAAALYGSLLYVGFLALTRKLHEPEQESTALCEPNSVLEPNSMTTTPVGNES